MGGRREYIDVLVRAPRDIKISVLARLASLECTCEMCDREWVCVCGSHRKMEFGRANARGELVVCRLRLLCSEIENLLGCKLENNKSLLLVACDEVGWDSVQFWDPDPTEDVHI